MPEQRPAPSREIYRRAPVLEAAIHIRCTNRPTFTMADIGILADGLSGSFQQEAEAVEHTEVRSDRGRQITERPVGLILRSYPDERAVVQLGIESLTYSHTAPYERWEVLRDAAHRTWEQYAAVANPQIVHGVSVRYINRLDLGEVIDDLAPFLTMYPVTPWNLKAPPSGFSLQVRLPREDEVVLVVNLATIQHVETHEMAILLDLDAIVEVNLEPDVGAIWNVVEQLHVTVEEAFESLITDRVRELIR